MQDKLFYEVGKLYVHSVQLQDLINKLQMENKQKDEQIIALQGELNDASRKGESSK